MNVFEKAKQAAAGIEYQLKQTVKALEDMRKERAGPP